MRDRLKAAGVDSPERDARRLAEIAFGLVGFELIAHEQDKADLDALQRLIDLAARRIKGEPVARLIGTQEFYGLTFKLVPQTLIPRPETEMLVDFALSRLSPTEPTHLLDLGTGTGCIAISILVHLPQATAVAIDLSPEAVACAKANAESLGVADRLDLRTGYWFKPLKRTERFDLLVSNPPYIKTSDLDTLMTEVREHDPRPALDGGIDGLNAHRAIAFTARTFVKQGGLIAFECGAGQGPAVANILRTGGFSGADVKKDLAGLDRVVFAHHS